MWFTELAEVREPGREELQRFVEITTRFLSFVLDRRDFGFLWEDDPELLGLARDTFATDVMESANDLRKQVESIPQETLAMHGLVGSPLRFKFRVMDAIGRQWERVRHQFTIREWFKRLIDAIDAALDSLIAAAGGVGSLLKEFKDALSALARTVP